MDLKNSILECVHKMLDKHFYEDYENPEFVMLIKPEGYYKILYEAREQIRYLNTDYINGINFLSIMGFKIPVIIDDSLSENIVFQLLTRKDYERIEKEKLYKRFYEMWK